MLIGLQRPLCLKCHEHWNITKTEISQQINWMNWIDKIDIINWTYQTDWIPMWTKVDKIWSNVPKWSNEDKSQQKKTNVNQSQSNSQNPDLHYCFKNCLLLELYWEGSSINGATIFSFSKKYGFKNSVQKCIQVIFKMGKTIKI